MRWSYVFGFHIELIFAFALRGGEHRSRRNILRNFGLDQFADYRFAADYTVADFDKNFDIFRH